MVDIPKMLMTYSKLNCLDLLTELPGCSFEWNDTQNNILYFEITNPDSMVFLLTELCGNYTYGNNCTYKYADGTTARFVKTRKWYEFKKYGKPYARIKIGG